MSGWVAYFSLGAIICVQSYWIGQLEAKAARTEGALLRLIEHLDEKGLLS